MHRVDRSPDRSGKRQDDALSVPFGSTAEIACFCSLTVTFGAISSVTNWSAMSSMRPKAAVGQHLVALGQRRFIERCSLARFICGRISMK